MRHGTATSLWRLVRALEATFGEVVCLTGATRLGHLPEGSLVVLRVRVEDADGLNLARPILLQNRLRVVLHAEDDAAGLLAAAAPDLASWIMQSFEPEPELPVFVVAGLRAAITSGRGIGIAWQGGVLDAELADLGVPVVAVVNGDETWARLVTSLRDAPPGLVRVVTRPWTDLARVGWAAAEAGREGAILCETDAAPPGWWRIRRLPMSWSTAAIRLGGERGALLAALLECEPDAIEIAAARLAAGEDVEALIKQVRAADPGAALASAPAFPLGGPAPVQRSDTRAGWDGWAERTVEELRARRPQEGEVGALVAATRVPMDLAPDDGFPALWIEAAGALVRPGATDAQLAAAAWLARAGGRIEVASAWAERVVAEREARPERGAAWIEALRLLARVRTAEARFEEARAVIEEAVAAVPADGDPLMRAKLLDARGRVRLKLGELEGAGEDLLGAVEQAHVAGALILEARARGALAGVFREGGRLADARGEVERALATLDAALDGDDDLVRGGLLCLRGTLAHLAGDLLDARVDLDRALAILRHRLGWEGHPAVRTARRDLACVQRDAGNLDDAHAELSALLEVERRERHPSRLVVILQELASVDRARGDLAAAQRHFEEAVTLVRGVGALRAYLPTALQGLARVHVARGDPDSARALYREALDAQRVLGPGARAVREAELGEELGELLMRQGDAEAGEELLRQAHGVCRGVLGDGDARTVRLGERVGRREVSVEGESAGMEEALRRIAAYVPESGELRLSGLGLRELPVGVRTLHGLHFLDLSFNQLSPLPDWIGDLATLESLGLMSNRLAVLPDGMSRLKLLSYLDLDENPLETLPEWIAGLRLLAHLHLSGTGVRELPPFLSGHPIELLALDRLGLKAVPPVVATFAQLGLLSLRDNDLDALPSWLTHRPLTYLDLRGNPRLHIPAALLDPTKPKDLLTWYFRSRARHNQPLNEVKLLLVGRGEAGKTAIRERLLHDRFRKTRETQGIDILPWTLRVDEQDVRVNVWDFAGQTITHATHQFFLTERSVYVLVLTGRGDTQKSDADYWLRLIRAFGTDHDGVTSPVVVVLNKWEEHAFKLDRNRLRENFPFIAGFIETDCRSGLGLPALRERLAEVVAGLESVRMPFPSAWWEVKERLEAVQRKKSHIPYGEFQAICAELGEETADEQATLSRILHALGIALNYADDPRLRSSTVLNPRWVTDGIYRILREAVSDAGELTLADVTRVLPRERKDMRRYLVELMRRFDLAFPISDADDRWLVPQRLPEEQPELGPEWYVPTATRVRWRYPILPEGLLPRFITRTWPLSASGTAADAHGGALPRWVNGVVVEDGNARALVRADAGEREVTAVVIGDEADRPSLLAVIRAELGRIHEDMPGLNPIEEVEVRGRPGWAPVSTLRADERSGQTSSVSTERGTITFAPTAELDRLSTREARDPSRSRLRVFISYSSRDARQKDELLMRLKPLEAHSALVSTWHDRCLLPGEPWDRRIRDELERADVILLLVSASFLASDYVREAELKRAIERADAGEAILVPVLLERCDWEREDFARFAALPSKARPIRDWTPQRNGLHEVAVALRVRLEELRGRRRPA